MINSVNDSIFDLEEFLRMADCSYKLNEPMSEHTTFRVGGPCDIMVFPDTQEKMIGALRRAKELGIKTTVLGNGSNVLFTDKGYRGMVVVLGQGFSDVTVDGSCITALAGALLIKICKTALDNDLTGMEFAYGIPGTVGGGVFMNAGAYGGEMKDIVKSVTCVDPEGKIKIYSGDELCFGYRKSRFVDSGETILSAEFSLEKGDHELIRSKMDELMARRISRQPLDHPSAGSTFKRPEGTYAGLVIEQSGLKGYSVGGAQVSEKHANFVINKGGATAKDITDLISHIKKTVKEKTGYELECEVKIIE